MIGMRVGALAAALVLMVGCAPGADSSDGHLTGGAALLVGAASDLRPAFEEIGELFTEETGHEVTFDFGSSGQIAQRIVEGAPFDVFASADVEYVDRVMASGRGDTNTKTTYAFGRITIWSRVDSWGDWTGLDDLVADPGVGYLAVANPEHAPYGRAARQALEASGLWEVVETRLVIGENISDTRRLAETGDADAAIVALSMAIAAGGRGEWVLIDDGLHDPLEQALVVVTGDAVRVGPARAFAEFVSQPKGREVMLRYGFTMFGDGGGA